MPKCHDLTNILVAHLAHSLSFIGSAYKAALVARLWAVASCCDTLGDSAQCIKPYKHMRCVCVYVCVYIYIYIYIYVHVYIYIYIERERDVYVYIYIYICVFNNVYVLHTYTHLDTRSQHAVPQSRAKRAASRRATCRRRWSVGSAPQTSTHFVAFRHRLNGYLCSLMGT